MEAIKENLRSYHGVIRASLAYVIRKTIRVQTYGDYPMYATHDNEMITWMLHLPSDKNKVHKNAKCTVSYSTYSIVQDKQ